MSGNGTLTITVGDANFNQATGTYTIDCSSWLRSKVEEIWNNNVYVTCDAHNGNEDGDATATAELRWSSLTKTKTDTDSWECTGDHGGYTKSNMANAWSKGWNACNSGNGRDENPYL
jgi:hypothetical protein